VWAGCNYEIIAVHPGPKLNVLKAKMLSQMNFNKTLLTKLNVHT